MDLGEAKMCRLCGQYERICIDVFGAEGVKRYLGSKIRRRINIQVKKSDKMPQQICHNCCSKLISWCKFYDLCHTTQKKFQRQFNKEVAENSVENDENNVDKENIPPSINNERHERSPKKPQNISEEKLTNIVIKEEVDVIDEQPLESLIPLFNEEQSPKTLHLSPNKEQSLESLPPLSNEEQSPETLHLLSNKEQLSEPSHLLSNKEQSSEPLHSQSNKEQSPMDSLPKPMVWIHLKLSQDESNVPDTLTSNMQNNRVNNGNNDNGSKYIKVSELITEEQRKAIETYYEKDQSIIEKYDKEVKQNMIVKAKNIIECKICCSTYSRRDKCEVHIRTHLNIKPFKCKKCDFATVTISNIRCHIRKGHLKIKPFVCTVCPKQYTTAVLLKEHMNTHTGERPYKCDMCKFSSTSRQNLSNHMYIHKSNKQSTLCKVCGKNFKTPMSLRMHMRYHDNNYVTCHICGARLLNEKNLEEHKKKVHACDYNCSICNKTYKSKKALNNHMNVHADASHKCTKCPNVYKNKHILMEHILKHDGIRNYKCTVCAKRFSQLSHLAAHKKVHSSPQYQCSYCHRKFNRHDNMKIHQKKCKKYINKEKE